LSDTVDRGLLAGALAVLETANARHKATAARTLAADWRSGGLILGDVQIAPDRPARPDRPELLPPRKMPRRRRAEGERGRIALLHALAHIELNAIDLACDMIVRFADQAPDTRFFDDWVKVAGEEALHFTLLADRLADFAATYGDLPAHDGLWQAAEVTADDVLARLAVVPMVLEARGLDVTPGMIADLERVGDRASAAVVERIYTDEIGHVAIGNKWFTIFCALRGRDPAVAWPELVRARYRGFLKPPFNDEARQAAGLSADLYRSLTAPN
jgi:uncharacterized ferritin-like protein (DUF455 family)